MATGGLISLASAGTALLVLTGTSAVMPGRQAASLPAFPVLGSGQPGGAVVVVPEAPRSAELQPTRPIRGGSTGAAAREAGSPGSAVRILFPGPLTGVVPGSSPRVGQAPPSVVPGLGVGVGVGVGVVGGQPALPGNPVQGPVVDIPVVGLPVVDIPVVDIPVVDLPDAGPVVRPRAPIPTAPAVEPAPARDDKRDDKSDAKPGDKRDAKPGDRHRDRDEQVRAALRAQQAAFAKEARQAESSEKLATRAAKDNDALRRQAERVERLRAALRADQARAR